MTGVLRRHDGASPGRPGNATIARWCGLATCVVAVAAHATTYRCEIDGRVTYGDTPCTSGAQSTVANGTPVDPAERAAAAARLRRDQAQLSQIDRDRARERQQDLRALALAKKRDSDIARNAQACTRLARRARNAHDAFDLAGPSDQAKSRLKMQRADQDFAALCKR